MFEDDQIPLTLNATLSEIYHQADSCRQRLKGPDNEDEYSNSLINGDIEPKQDGNK